jgi:hypothetical protein
MHVHQAASFSWKEDPWSDLLYMVCRVWSASQIYWMTLEVHLLALEKCHLSRLWHWHVGLVDLPTLKKIVQRISIISQSLFGNQ